MTLRTKISALSLAVIIAVVFAATAWAAGGVAGTKHNLGSLSPAAIKTDMTATSEICVFCHTPHNSRPATPMWNKADTGSTYEPYASKTLAATISPKPLLGQPTGASKLCLSCHDGTIALGELLNLPGPGTATIGGTLPVTGPGVTAGKLTAGSVSYIGTNLKDDHPVSFDYSLSYPSNPDIKSSPFTPSEVKLDNAGRVECTACHDPHGRVNPNSTANPKSLYPKFMVAELENGTLCMACHDNLNWIEGIHSTSVATWNGSVPNPWNEDMGAPGFSDDTPALQACLACHRSHGGAIGKTLLKGNGEEEVCLTCHNGNAASADVDASFGYTYTHDVKSVTWAGRHTPARSSAGEPAREDVASLVNANRHVECADCHNGHGARLGGHVMGTFNGYTIGATLVGGWGVIPSPWAAAGMAATTYTVVDFNSTTPGQDNLEGYVCVKCHSYYAYANLPPQAPSGNADNNPVKESDVTADFNTNNPSFHPVFAQGLNQPNINANPNWVALGNNLGLTNTFNYGYYDEFGEQWETGVSLTTPPSGLWNVKYDSTITCSDCHGSNIPSDPKGVHGSNEKWILRAEESGRVLFPVVTQKNFCYNCHRRDVYGDEDYTPPKANYARVSHPIDGLAATASPFYQSAATSGANTGNSGNNFGILCLTCHGGAYVNIDNAGVPLLNDAMQGIHGTNADVCGCQNNGQCTASRCPVPPLTPPVGFPPAGAAALANRAMNGACVEFHVPATTALGVSLYFRAITIGTDAVCNNNFTDVVGGNPANYDY